MFRTALGLYFDAAASPIPACAELLRLADTFGLSVPSLRLTGHKRVVKRERLLDAIQHRADRFFTVSCPAMNLHFLPGNGPDVNLKLEFSLDSLVPAILDSWAVSLLTQEGSCYVRLYSIEYDRWQNEPLVSNFELMGRSIDGLRTAWDAALREQIVLTTFNPGRRAAGSRCTEALGHEMWLGPHFWGLTGAHVSQVRECLRTRELPEGVIGVTVSEHPFNLDNPPSEGVRTVFFPSGRPIPLQAVRSPVAR